jgi:hypothetical protein
MRLVDPANTNNIVEIDSGQREAMRLAAAAAAAATTWGAVFH